MGYPCLFLILFWISLFCPFCSCLSYKCVNRLNAGFPRNDCQFYLFLFLLQYFSSFIFFFPCKCLYLVLNITTDLKFTLGSLLQHSVFTECCFLVKCSKISMWFNFYSLCYISLLFRLNLLLNRTSIVHSLLFRLYRQCTRWFKYDRDWCVCKQAALRSSCAALREWSHNLHPPSC